MGSTFRALRYRNFAYLWVGQTGHSATIWMDVVARSVLVLNLTGSPFLLSVVLAARTIPILIFGLLAGAIADRVDRRRLLLVTQAVVWGSHLYLGIAIVGGFIEYWQVLVTAVIFGTAMSFNQPARQALIPMLVPRESVLNAVALNATSVSFMRIGGGSIAGVLLIVFNEGGLYLVNAALYTIVMGSTVLMRIEGGAPQAPRRARRSLVGDVSDGFAYVVRNPNLAVIVALAMILFVFGFPYQQFFIPVLAKEVLDIGDAGVGWLMAATGAGALTGSLFVASRTTFARPAVQMVINLIVFAGMLLGVAVAAGTIGSQVLAVSLVAVLLAVAGAMTVTFMSFTNSLLLANSDSEMHGRVMSLLSLDRGLIPVGAILAGVLTSSIGTLPALFILGSLVLLLSLVALAFWGKRLAGISGDLRDEEPAQQAKGAAATEPQRPVAQHR